MSVSTPLVRTKLHRPSVPRDYVERKRLSGALSFTTPLTLVSAAAGYGKSVLVSGWLEEGDAPSAWVSLDETDNDLREFLRYVCAAVETLFPSVMSETRALLGAASLPPVPVLSGTLINELNRIGEPFTLVLDDVHRIRERPPLDVLTDVLNHPPSNLHLVLVGRRDPRLPIARMRARGQINEIRADGLRFTAAETAAFMARVLGREVGRELAGAWTEETEGWVTAIRLATLSVRTGSGEATPRQPFSHRKATRHTMQYLLLEVLERQEPAVRHHLLRSALADRFCASLCDALQAEAGEDGGTVMGGRAFLEWLDEADLFVIPLDDEGRWYRYHHLFQDLLREEAKRSFGPEAVAAVHLRASEWFENESLVDESLRHALAAADVDRAAQIVERHGRSVLNDDQWYVLDRWLSLLPDSVVQERPELLLARAWKHYYRLDSEAISLVLDRIDGLMGGDAGAHDLSGEVAFFRAVVSCLQGEGARSLKYVEYALDHISLTDSMFRGETESIFGLAGQMEGQLDRVTRTITGWLGDPSPLHPARETRLLVTLIDVYQIAGDLERSQQCIQRMRVVAGSHDVQNPLAWCDYLEGLLHLQRGELDAAIRLLEESGVRKHYQDVPQAAVDTLVALTLAYQARAQPEQAATTLQVLREFVTHLGPSFSVFAESCEARLGVMQGRHEAALGWLETSAPSPAEEMFFFFEIPCVTRCRALIAKGTAESLVEAQARLQEYAEQNEAHHNTCQRIPILALQAVAHLKQEKARDARDALDRALDLAEPGGYVFPFLELGAPMADLLRESLESSPHADFGKRILTAFYEGAAGVGTGRPQRAGAPSAPDADLLTSRQLEVLELLGQGLYQKEIAARLFVSTETVKTHLARIYRKLGVSNRRHAVDEARAKSLIARI